MADDLETPPPLQGRQTCDRILAGRLMDETTVTAHEN